MGLRAETVTRPTDPSTSMKLSPKDGRNCPRNRLRNHPLNRPWNRPRTRPRTRPDAGKSSHTDTAKSLLHASLSATLQMLSVLQVFIFNKNLTKTSISLLFKQKSIYTTTGGSQMEERVQPNMTYSHSYLGPALAWADRFQTGVSVAANVRFL